VLFVFKCVSLIPYVLDLEKYLNFERESAIIACCFIYKSSYGMIVT